MSVDPDSEARGLNARLAVARRASARADARLDDAIDDLFLADDARLDDRTRIAVRDLLGGIVRGIEADIRRQAVRLLTADGTNLRADALGDADEAIVDRLKTLGLLRDRRLMDELIARVRAETVGAALPIDIADADRASLLVRLADSDDGVVANAARQLLASEARRQGAAGRTRAGELPADLHRAIVWLIAAYIREISVAAAGDDIRVDRAIVEAARRSLAAHDETDRAEAYAMRLARAIDARPDERAPLLIEALRDRRLILFIACLAHALDLDFDSARGVVIDPDGDQLWLALRALDLDRPTIARIGLSLAEADSRRDLERFAEEIDQIAAIPLAVAQAAVAPLTLCSDLRQAIDTLARKGRR